MIYDFPKKLNDLKGKILRQKIAVMLGISQNYLRAQIIAQFPLQNWIFGSGAQKVRKRRCQSFSILSSFTNFI